MVRPLPAPLRAEATRILLDAFGLKFRYLELFVSDAEKVARLVERAIVAQNFYAAMEDGVLLGVAGVQDRDGRPNDFSYRLLRTELGPWGAAWRTLMRAFVDPPIRRTDTWRIAVIAVSAQARGKGIGTRLIERIVEDARAAGMARVVLEVVDTNPAARRLYERLGFAHDHTVWTGPFFARAGFRSYEVMTLVIGEEVAERTA